MQLIGEHQAEDRLMIADVVLAKMNHVPTRGPARPQQRAQTMVQQPQVRNLGVIDQHNTVIGTMDDSQQLYNH